VEHLGHLLLQVNAQDFGAIENELDCVGMLNSVFGEGGKSRLELLSSFRKDVGVLNNESADKLHVVPVLNDEVIVHHFDARLVVFVVQYECRLMTHNELELLNGEAVLLCN
jgi:hypothetical protein